MPKLQVNGATIHYHSHGEGLPIVFIHPPVVNSAVFRYQQVQLANSFRVVTFDIRGHGHSERSDQPVTYSLIVEDMKQLLDELEIEQAIVSGYSTGGGVALEALLTHPKRFVGGIIISGMSEVSDPKEKTRVAALNMLTKIGAKRAVAYGIARGNADMDITFHNLYNQAMNGDVRCWHQYSRHSLEYSCTNRLPRIHQPVLLVNGEMDRSFHRYAVIMQHKLPNVEQGIVKGMGHQIPTKASARLNGLIAHWVNLKFGDAASEMRKEEEVDGHTHILPADIDQEHTEEVHT